MVFKDNNVDVEPTIETSNMDLLVELTKNKFRSRCHNKKNL